MLTSSPRPANTFALGERLGRVCFKLDLDDQDSGIFSTNSIGHCMNAQTVNCPSTGDRHNGADRFFLSSLLNDDPIIRRG